MCEQKLAYNIKLKFGGVGVYVNKRYHIYQISVWRGGGIHEQKLTYNIKFQFGGVGVGVYMSKTIFSYTTWDTPYYRKNALKSEF